MADHAQIDAIAARLRQARERTGLTATEAASRFGWTPSTYYGHENGSRGIPRSKIVEYAHAFRVAPGWLLTGAQGQEVLQITRRVVVVGEVAAGVWQEEHTWDERKFEDIPTVPGPYESLEQAAYYVRGPSMDLERIFDGDYVIAVPYFMARTAYQEGDIVVVTRRQNGLTERTVKSIHLIEDGIELVPRSSDPRFQKPVLFKTGPVADADASDESIEITGLVIASHRRF